LLGQHVSRFLPAEEMVKLPTVLAELMSGNASSDRIEKHLIRLDGSLIYVEATAVVIDFQGETAVQLLIRDMTDRKRAELELAAKEKEFSRVIKLSPEPIILERMTKVVQIDAMMDFIEMKLKRLDGELVDIEVASICVNRTSANPVVQLVIRDLSKRKRTEEMIRRSDRLSIAGELAAGVAHEIRNPLTALKGFLQLLKVQNTAYVDIMLMEIDRISYIVNEFPGMAKPQVNHFIECDILTLMNSVIVFMNPQALLFNVEMN